MHFPMEMTGRIADGIQLLYRTPADSVRALVPAGLELVTRGPWAFWSVTASQMQRVRPAGVPGFCGLSYRQVSYRLHVQAMTDCAEVVRGFYTTHSESDASAIARLGQWMNGIPMQPTAIAFDADDCGVRVDVGQPHVGTLALRIDAAHAPAQRSDGSCFPTVDDARRFCRHDSNQLAVVEDSGRRHLRITHIERLARACSETPLTVRHAQHGYFESIGQADKVQLEWASRLGPADYRTQAGDPVALLQQPENLSVSVRIAS